MSSHFVQVSAFFSVLGKPVMSLAPENNDLMKKKLWNVWGLAFQGVSPVCTACALLLCSGFSFFRPVVCRGSPCLWAMFGPWPECDGLFVK